MAALVQIGHFASKAAKDDQVEPHPVLVSVRQDGHDEWSFIHRDGRLLPQRFESAKEFSDGLALVKTSAGYGYIRQDGNFAIAPAFVFARSFSEGVAAFCDQKGRWGFVDKTGKTIIAPQYSEVGDFSEGVAVAFEGSSGGYINIKNERVIAFSFFSAFGFSDGLALVKDYGGKNSRFINHEGKAAIDVSKYSSVNSFRNGLARVVHNESVGFLGKNGAMGIPIRYQDAEDFSEGRAAVKFDGKWGYIDKSGAWIVKPEIPVEEGPQRPAAFHEGLVYIKKAADGWSGYLNTDGARAIKVNNVGFFTDFHNGFADYFEISSNDGLKVRRWGCIDNKGSVIFEKENGTSR